MAQLTTRPWAVRIWMELEHSIRAGTPAFDHVHGMQIFEYFNKHPNELELFAAAMRRFSVATGAAVAETYDFSGIRTLADIGGSQGFILSLVLPKYPDMRGILFDLPAVVEGAPNFIKSYGSTTVPVDAGETGSHEREAHMVRQTSRSPAARQRVIANCTLVERWFSHLWPP
jgi:hypothetical protein